MKILWVQDFLDKVKFLSYNELNFLEREQLVAWLEKQRFLLAAHLGASGL